MVSPTSKLLNSEQSKLCIVFCIPYLGQLSFKIHNNSTKLIKRHYPDTKLQFVYKSPRRLSSFFKYKDIFQPLVLSMAPFTLNWIAIVAPRVLYRIGVPFTSCQTYPVRDAPQIRGKVTSVCR